MASDIWLRTILIVRKETRCRHIGYSYRLTARVLLYAPSHRQDNTYHSLCYTTRGALAGMRNSSMNPPLEGSIRRPIAPWANTLLLSNIPFLGLAWLLWSGLCFTGLLVTHWFDIGHHLGTTGLFHCNHVSKVNVLFNYAFNTLYLQLFIVKLLWTIQITCCCNFMGSSFGVATRNIFNVLLHRQDSTYHSLCGALFKQERALKVYPFVQCWY